MTHRRKLLCGVAGLALPILLAACQSGQPPMVANPSVVVQTPAGAAMTPPPVVAPEPAASQLAQPEAASTPAPAVEVSGADSIGDPMAPELGNTGYDVQKYTLRLRLDPAADSLDATAQIAARSTLDGLDRLSLDFVGYDVGQVLANGQPADFDRQDAKLWINLPEPLAACAWPNQVSNWRMGSAGRSARFSAPNP